MHLWKWYISYYYRRDRASIANLFCIRYTSWQNFRGLHHAWNMQRTYQKPWKDRNEDKFCVHLTRQSNGHRWWEEPYGAWSGRMLESTDERHQVSTAGLDSRQGGSPLIWRPPRLLDEWSTSALTSRRRIESAIKPNLMPIEQQLSTAYAQH